jgi:alkylation response protein AidB-like acyl-CoA dehydrogenase
VDFDLPAETEEFRGVVRSFAEEVVRPRAEEYDARSEFPIDVVRAMAELGLFGLLLPEAYGGSAADFLTLCVAIEELARVDSSVAITLSAAVGLGQMPFLLFGTEEQKQTWLPPMAAGETLGAFGLTEASGGSDVEALRTTARREGEEWVIDGSKAFITNAGTPLSKVVTVAALTGDTAQRGARREISAICVPHGTPGFTVGRQYRKLGWRASDTRELIFEACRVPAENLVGKEGDGYRQFLQILDGGRIGIAALSVGLAQGCLDESLAYARQRTAFGQLIGTYQAIQFKLADMATQIAAARDLVYRAAWLRERGRPFKAATSMAKLFASEVAMDCAREAVQIHGGYGFIEEFPVARHFRDAKVLEIGEGTSEIQRMLIARELGLPKAVPERGAG